MSEAAPLDTAEQPSAQKIANAASARWYVMHVYSGFEAKVKEAILDKAAKQGLDEAFHEILVPKEEVMEIKRGKRVATERNVFPGYVMVKMNMSDDAWHLVKNTPKVTGFLGSGNKPQAISEGEAARLITQLASPDGNAGRRTITFDIGEEIRITDGAFASMVGTVEEVDDEKGRLKASVSIFGRPTPVELEFGQVEKTA
jgi:transcription termination/antitermination protein NusG